MEQSLSNRAASDEINGVSRGETGSKKSADSKKRKITKRVMKALLISAFIVLMILCTKTVQKCMKIIRVEWQNKLGPVWFPIVLTIIFSIWLSVSPNGSAPTILSGVIWNNQRCLAIAISYISINIGSFLNLLWIRHLVIKHEKSKCVHLTLKLLFIDKFRKTQFVRKLFETWHPIKILIILRLPYFNAGIVNYLFAFQSDKIDTGQYLIGNAIGFIPGSIVFCLFGYQINNLIDSITKEETYLCGFEKNKFGIVILLCCMVAVVIAYVLLIKYVRSIIKKAEDAQENVSK